MSSNYTSTSYSFSSSSMSSSSGNGQSTGTHQSTQSQTTPHGTTVRTTHQNLGGPTTEEVRHYDHQGRELLEAPTGAGNAQGRIQDVEVEDVTDETEADRKYREAMEDEYAKREGGA